jgi:outer membrane beta-barrel protein
VSIKSQLLCIAFRVATLASVFSGIPGGTTFAAVGGYKKATEGGDVIKNKLYPKKNRVELNGPNLGLILNQSYIDTYLINGGINYFWSESWGLGAELTIALNKDRYERDCIESFYNDVDYDIPEECGGPESIQDYDGDGQIGNYGPAYVNIREYNMLLTGNAIWNPIYGKEIFFLSGVVNFDVFLTMGGGLAMTTFYPLQTYLNNGKESRGNFPAPNSGGARPGAEPDEVDSFGKAGRPQPQKESKVFLDAGIGQKIHINKTLNFKAELRNHLVLGTPGGFDMFFTLWAGLGARF